MPVGRGTNLTTTQPVVRTSLGWTLQLAPSAVSVKESSRPSRQLRMNVLDMITDLY